MRSFVIAITILFSHAISAQQAFNTISLDSTILGEKVNNFTVSDFDTHNLPLLELSVYKIDGTVEIQPASTATKAPTLKNIFCRRTNGQIATLYFLFENAQPDIIKQLFKRYGEPQQIIKPMIPDSNSVDATGYTWIFSDHSIYYSYIRGHSVVILNNDPEATFYKIYDEYHKPIKQ